MSQLFQLYGPSFISRYSLQFTIVALPWLLQINGHALNQISYYIVFFFLGATISGLMGGRFLHKIPLKKGVILLSCLQILMCIVCFANSAPQFLPLNLFIFGVSLGLYKPLSRLWTIEVTKNVKSNANVVANTITSEIFVSLGAALAGFLATQAFSNQYFSGLPAYVLLVFTLPTGILIYLSYCPLNFPNTEVSAASSGNPFKGTLGLLNKASPGLNGAGIYFLSMIIFTLWIIKVPYSIRELPNSPLSTLGLALSLHPLGMLLGQVIASRFVSSLSLTNDRILWLMAAIGAAQGLLTWISIYTGSQWAIVFLFFFGGGFLPAFVFPLFMLLLKDYLASADYRARSHVMILSTLAIDLGQLIAMGLLSSRFSDLPMFGMPILFFLITCVAILGTAGKRVRT